MRFDRWNSWGSSVDNEVMAEFLGMDITRQELADGSWRDRTGQGQNNLVDDPLFMAGWPQVDLRVRPDSPAIDGGDDAACPA